MTNKTQAELVMDWLISPTGDTSKYGNWGDPLLGLFQREIIPQFQGKDIDGGYVFPDRSGLMTISMQAKCASPERFKVLMPGDQRLQNLYLMPVWDQRSLSYCKAVANNINLFDIKFVDYGLIEKQLKENQIEYIALELTQAELFTYKKDEKTRYVAEVVVEGFGDWEDKSILLYFNSKPSDKDIKRGAKLHGLIMWLHSKEDVNLVDYFGEHHWLDVSQKDDIEIPEALEYFIRN